MGNRRKPINNKSGFKGVTKEPFGKYRASININGQQSLIGYFGTAQEAADAYDLKAIELRGEFALTNKMEREAA
jgi:hypothetical protein